MCLLAAACKGLYAIEVATKGKITATLMILAGTFFIVKAATASHSAFTQNAAIGGGLAGLGGLICLGPSLFKVCCPPKPAGDIFALEEGSNPNASTSAPGFRR